MIASGNAPGVILLRTTAMTMNKVHGVLEQFLRNHEEPWTDFIVSISDDGYRTRRVPGDK